MKEILSIVLILISVCFIGSEADAYIVSKEIYNEMSDFNWLGKRVFVFHSEDTNSLIRICYGVLQTISGGKNWSSNFIMSPNLIERY